MVSSGCVGLDGLVGVVIILALIEVVRIHIAGVTMVLIVAVVTIPRLTPHTSLLLASPVHIIPLVASSSTGSSVFTSCGIAIGMIARKIILLGIVDRVAMGVVDGVIV
jgi:hypothetical protein